MDETGGRIADQHTEHDPSLETEKAELENDTKQVPLADSPKDEDTYANAYTSNLGEEVTAGKADKEALEQDGEGLENPAVTGEAANSEPGDTAGAANSEPGDMVGATNSEPGDMVGATNSEPGDTAGAANSEPGDMVGAANSEPGDMVGAANSEPGDMVGATNSEPGDMVGAANSEPRDMVGAANSEPGDMVGAANSEPGDMVGAANSEPGDTAGAANSEPGDTPTSESGEDIEGRGHVPQPPTGSNTPTNENSEELEAPELKPPTGEPPSRDPSVILEGNDNTEGLLKLDLETPERESTSPVQEEKEEEEADNEEETAASPPVGEDTQYAEYTELLGQLQAEREEASRHHGRLQIKLLQYLSRNRRWDEARPEKEKPLLDQEHRYPAILEELWHQTKILEEQKLAEQLRLQGQEEHQPQVDRERRALMAAERDVAAAALTARLGRQAAQDELGRIQESERRREQEGVRVRLENVRLTYRIRKLEESLWPKVRLAGDTCTIDCEQLKVDNQDFNKKIDKRADEVLKLRMKITSSVEVLTHVKEKLQWAQTEAQAKRAQLRQVEAAVAVKRDVLTRTKQACDDLRVDKLRLRRRRGLLENHELLWDFEDKLAATAVLEDDLGGLERWYAENVLLRSTGRRGLGEEEARGGGQRRRLGEEEARGGGQGRRLGEEARGGGQGRRLGEEEARGGGQGRRLGEEEARGGGQGRRLDQAAVTTLGER